MLEPRPGPAPAQQELTDAELDAYILTRLRLLGVDLSVLPDDDPDAPADRRRVLVSARRFLRSTPGAIAEYEMDPMTVAPAMYPPSSGIEGSRHRAGGGPG